MISPEPVVCNDILVSDTAMDTLTVDAFGIGGVQIDSFCMKIWVLYGGGCGEVFFEMAASEYWIDAFPRERDMVLGFRDYDPCEALVSDTVRYDLTPLQDPDHNSVVLNLEGWPNPVIYNY